MAKITVKCKYCKKPAEVKSEKRLEKLGKIQKTYTCGHTVFENIIARKLTDGYYFFCKTCAKTIEDLYEYEEDFNECERNSHEIIEIPLGRDSAWLDAFEYQKTGVQFIENANFNALVADEMGLGKTIQALLALRYNFESLTPCLIIPKSSLIFNWLREYKKWVLSKWDNGEAKKHLAMPHFDGQVELLPGFDVYIVSMDMLSKPAIMESIKEIGFKSLIIDESHNFKNDNSKRTAALTKLASNIPHKVLLSGTPIMNHFMEYFTSLNLVKPDHWPSKYYMARSWAHYDSETKRWLGISPGLRNAFFNKTSSYIIRREKKDVLKDLPELRINKKYFADFSEDFVKAYNQKLQELDLLLARMSDKFNRTHSVDILAMLSHLRHLTGISKIKPCIELVSEFLEFTEGEKITIGIHHQDVRYWIMKGLEKWKPIEMSGEDSPTEKERKESLFKLPERRVLVANILAAGEGRNLQFCNNFIILERQWNPAKEDQFVARFQRPKKCLSCDILLQKLNGKYKCPKCNNEEEILPVTGDILIAEKTIDDFFDQLVTLKSQVVDSVMDKNVETDYAAIYELAQRVVQSRLRYAGC